MFKWILKHALVTLKALPHVEAAAAINFVVRSILYLVELCHRRQKDDGSVEIDVGFYKERPAPISGVDENKFPKVAEAIRAIKNKKLN